MSDEMLLLIAAFVIVDLGAGLGIISGLVEGILSAVGGGIWDAIVPW